ncbi:hypothetical protein APR04_001002 [Promicromonospora umidemergens]|uniref:DUF4149 domain-containing protein n=1 Tax=Promicromonospora umidemergens TaxID=629679 RepID=A0ABP8XP27_9MICO|nr:hypothetical protein [Promicromonospora umidemergens]MCP2282107.1 hypothetical protein [Promicromonospora umidemergens]
MTESTLRPAGSRPGATHPVRTRWATLRTLSAAAFALAVLAGVAETVVAVSSIVAQDGTDGAVVAQALVRGLIFAAALVCAWFLARGRRWAWWALLLGLGMVGLASMVVPMATALADGASWSTAFEGDVSPAFPVIRALHILFVLVGVGVMLRPEVRASLSPGR